jgi:hypothetical protein
MHENIDLKRAAAASSCQLWYLRCREATGRASVEVTVSQSPNRGQTFKATTMCQVFFLQMQASEDVQIEGIGGRSDRVRFSKSRTMQHQSLNLKSI